MGHGELAGPLWWFDPEVDAHISAYKPMEELVVWRQLHWKRGLELQSCEMKEACSLQWNTALKSTRVLGLGSVKRVVGLKREPSLLFCEEMTSLGVRKGR